MQPIPEFKRLIRVIMINEKFWQLLEREHVNAERFSRNLCGNIDDGDDLYQDSVLTAAIKFKSLKDHRSFKPWLYQIISNKFKSQRRKKMIKLKNQTDRIELPPNTVNSEERNIKARGLLNRAFRAVTSEEQSLITLFEIEGWSITELSNLYGKPPGTIKSKLSRTRAKMRKELKNTLIIRNSLKLKSGAKYALPENN